jgi:hypothetical protein
MVKDLKEIVIIFVWLFSIGYFFSQEGLIYKILFGIFCFVFALYITQKYENELKIWTSKIYGLCKWWNRWKVINECEGIINRYSKKIISEELIGRKPYGVKIQLVKGDEKEDEIFQNGELIIRLKDSGSPNRNFIAVALRFVSKTLIPDVKIYLHETITKSIDLFSVQKLLNSGKKELIPQFFEEFCLPEIKKEPKIGECFKYYKLIDNVGIFNRILLQELLFLGEKAHFQFKPQDPEVTNEVVGLINFLKNIAGKKPKEKAITGLDFRGNVLKTGIVLVAEEEKRIFGEYQRYTIPIERAFKTNMETMYLMGLGSNVNFVKIIAHYLNKNKGFKKIKEYFYSIRRGERKTAAILILYKKK